MTRPGVLVAAAALLCLAAGAALTGILPWTHALAGALVLATLLAVYRATGTVIEDPDWPRRPQETRSGGRHEVSDLGWSLLGRDGRVREQVAHRVRDLARARLRGTTGTTGATPDDRDDLDPRLTRLGIDPHTRPTTRTLSTWLDTIERLTDDPDEKEPRP